MTRNNLKSQGVDFDSLTKHPYQKPTFNYIGFCKHLNLNEMEEIIDMCL